MEGLTAAGTRKDRLIQRPFQAPPYQLPLPEAKNPHTTRTLTRVVKLPSRSQWIKAPGREERQAELFGRLGPLPE